MVSVEGGKWFEDYGSLLRQSEIERPFPSRLHSELSSLGNNLFPYDDVLLNDDMDLEPTLLESMFPTITNGVRRGRHFNYDVTSPCFHLERIDSLESPHASANVRVIPIKVEYGNERHQDDIKFRLLNGSPKETEAGKTYSSSRLGDGVPEFIEFASPHSPPDTRYGHRAHLSGNMRTNSPNTPNTYTSRSRNFSPYDSSHNLWKYYTEHDSQTTPAWKSVPVKHLETSKTPISNAKPNSNNNSSGRKDYKIPTSSDHLECSSKKEDGVNYSSLICSRNSSTSSIHTLVNEDLEYDEMEVNDPPNYPIYDILKVQLVRENRIIDYIKGDGNCFFRALSKVLYGSEKYHKTIRSLIVDIIATNKSKFGQFVDGENVQMHVQMMAEDNCWATTCEIYAATTLLQRDIYMLTPDHLNKNYSWLLFKALFKIEHLHSDIARHPCYITLCNTNGNHYDRVLADHRNCNCFLPHPKLGGIGMQ